MAGCIPVWIQWSLLGRFRTLGTGILGWSVGWWLIHRGFCTLAVGSNLHQLSSDSTRWADCSWDIWKHNLVSYKFWNYFFLILYQWNVWGDQIVLLWTTLVVSTVSILTLAGVFTSIIPFVSLVVQFILVDAQVLTKKSNSIGNQYAIGKGKCF